MDFFRSYLFKNEPLISYPFLSSKLDSPVIKTLERHSLNVKKCLSNVLITGEYNLDPYFKRSIEQLKYYGNLSTLVHS